MKAARPSTASLRRALADIRVWLMGAMAWLAETLRRTPIGPLLAARVRRDLYAVRADMADLLVVLAFRAGGGPRRRRQSNESAAPAGPCVRLRRPRRRPFVRALALRGSLRARIAALAAALEALDATIARFVVRVFRPRGPILSITTGPAHAPLRLHAVPPAPVATDTS